MKGEQDMKYTELEKSVMETLSHPNGNGEMCGVNEGDYLELWNFKMDNKVLRGVLSSLVKKDIIKIYDWEFGTVVELTENGFDVLANLKY